MVWLHFHTPCGHKAIVKPKPVSTGSTEDTPMKWICRIKGPSITTKSGVKTRQCDPNEESAIAKIATVLNLSACLVTKTTGGDEGSPSNIVRSNVVGSNCCTPTELQYETTATSATMTGNRPIIATMRTSEQKKELEYCGISTGLFLEKNELARALVQARIDNDNCASTHFSTRVKAESVHSRDIKPEIPLSHQIFPPEVVVSATTTSTSCATTITPTDEQNYIYSLTKKTDHPERHVVRITAGAGTGKTTTILQLAAKATKMGHTHITYVTFSRAAADDGKRRISETLLQALDGRDQDHSHTLPLVEARTLHSCAMKLLDDKRKEEREIDSMDPEPEQNSRIWDEGQLEKFIQSTCEGEINDFMVDARNEIDKRMANSTKPGTTKTSSSMVESAERLVLFYICKSLTSFCQSADKLEQFKDSNNKRRIYYPARKFHERLGDGDKRGFPFDVYENKVGFYADMACRIWDEATTQGIRTYDLEMKRAQLLSLRIPGTLLLVDESQDMDGCQVDWVAGQADHAHVYLVGDAAQTIYSFRGAKSKHMMNVWGAQDSTLTKSWRFGTTIANIANVILFSKEYSPQTTANDYAPIWRPYRLQGCGGNGRVVADSILDKWKEMPVTIIAMTNATLLLTAVCMLGMTINDKGTESQDMADTDSNTESPSEDLLPEPPENVLSSPNSNSSPVEIVLPKIHINGKGENSGRKKWKSVLKQITFLYDLYKSGDEGIILPKDRFPEFYGIKTTWGSFISEVEVRELNRYVATIAVVSKFQEQTLEAMELFERQVMENNYSVEEADVVLTTCHAAKGMEWDNVQVCEDFFNFVKVNDEGPLVLDNANKTSRKSWQFDMKNYGDDANILYVACTRAKKILAIPTSIKNLFQDCDMLHDLIRRRKLYEKEDGSIDSGISVLAVKELSIRDSLNLYNDLVLPLRKQFNLQTKDTLIKALVETLDKDDSDNTDHYTDNETLKGDDTFEQYFGLRTKLGTKIEEPPIKKQKLARIFYVLEDAKKSATLAPKNIRRPYDKKDMAPTGKAKCRDCGKCIDQGSERIAVQVYQPTSSAFWAYAFHRQCCPKESLEQLRLDPNPSKMTPMKSWGKKGRGGYHRGGGRKYGGRRY